MTTEINDKDVASFLAANPEFFLSHESLLTKMKLPDNRKGTISLVEKQMDVMRDRQRKSKKQLKEFVEAAESNKEIFDKSRKLVLDLMAANRSSAFFTALEKGLKRDFKCKAYSLIVFGKPRQINHFTSRVHKDTARDYVGALMRAKEPTLGVLRPTEQDFLFRHQSQKVKSAAVLSVKQRNKQLALLAIGSGDPNYFSSNMDTLFIGFIADALAKLLPRHLPK
ncbi:MAG: DUF484 family protein [Gammaproteobacteria bacterium]|jgi:uncharacterized protein|nr:DUF484 family protein [Gammaproteobacteria bacterium]MBT4494643.1 DUF484 family protein [Gammaproteobacteria bacterium]MBT7370895.1 DUF484 family protein [Gammaproteobacteria bacterium]